MIAERMVRVFEVRGLLAFALADATTPAMPVARVKKSNTPPSDDSKDVSTEKKARKCVLSM